jgi:hypothetical protein
MAETVEESRRIVADLEGKAAAAEARAVELQTERRRLSFDANTGDETARKALDKLNKEAATAGLEVENIRSAIEEAKRRLSAAERDEAMAAARENAGRAAEIADRIAERGPRIDEAFVKARAELEGLKSDVDELHKLGITHPRGEQLEVLCGLALSTHLMLLPIKAQRDHLAPRERRSFSELFTGWAQGARNRASSFLGENEEAA